MATWRIVADSSCDLRSYQPAEQDVSFTTVPLKIVLGQKEFVDDEQLDALAMMDALDASADSSSSACPSPEEWRAQFMQGDYILAVTISSGLSGSYNSAMLAKNLVLEEYPQKKIHVVDSRSASGQMVLLIRKIQELIAAENSFEEVVSGVEAYNKELKILFVLSSFKNLAKNGRISRAAGFLAARLNMRVVGHTTPEGKIDFLFKSRGENATIKKLVDEMSRLKDLCGKDVVIAHCNNLPGADQLKCLVEKAFHGVKVTILTTGGLTSYYAERYGIIVSF